MWARICARVHAYRYYRNMGNRVTWVTFRKNIGKMASFLRKVKKCSWVTVGNIVEIIEKGWVTLAWPSGKKQHQQTVLAQKSGKTWIPRSGKFGIGRKRGPRQSSAAPIKKASPGVRNAKSARPKSRWITSPPAGQWTATAISRVSSAPQADFSACATPAISQRQRLSSEHARR